MIETRRRLSRGSVEEHIQAGAQSILIGQSVARYFIWDAKRALDYLLSRPEVDPARAGAAGCSGGGALTAYIGALDRRIKAVISGCYFNSRSDGLTPRLNLSAAKKLGRNSPT